jgi:hypothetical protein
MDRRSSWQDFIKGVVAGMLGTLGAGLALLYLPEMMDSKRLAFSAPDIQQLARWIYANLRWSLIPFTLTLLLYAYSLIRLKRHLSTPTTLPAKVAQAEHLLDIWINLFFGIGVIWTAIGIRNALLTALGGLDPVVAAELGAFTILQRLVDGGILLALSTTIFGAAGGYLLRLNKAIIVGTQLQTYYGEVAQRQNDEIDRTLHHIEQHLSELVHHANRRQQEG